MNACNNVQANVNDGFSGQEKKLIIGKNIVINY